MTLADATRQDLIDDLINTHGLEEHEIYLIDLFPLIEMIWVDGQAQKSETAVVTEFCLNRIAELDSQTNGESPLSVDQANSFLEKYLTNKPDPELLKTIRTYIKPVALNHSDPNTNEERKDKVIDYCLDIASAAVCTYPYERADRFSRQEKQLLKTIIKSLG